MEKGLSERQKVFCEEYLIDLNGAAAARRAGYSHETARSEANRLLTNADILAYIREKMDERSKETLVDARFVIEGLKELLDRCLQKTPVMEFDPVKKQMVQQMTMDEEGNEIGVWAFDSHGAAKALELLGKHLILFTEKNQTKVTEIRIVDETGN